MNRALRRLFDSWGLPFDLLAGLEKVVAERPDEG